MMKTLDKALACVCASLLLAASASAADGLWQGVNGSWADSANWVDGIIPSDGGTAYFAGGVTTFTNDIPGLVLGGITTSNNTPRTLGTESIPFAFPPDPASTSRIDIADNYLHFYPPLGTGNGVIVKTGTAAGSRLAFYNNALFTGRWLIITGRVEIASAEALLVPPPALVPDAVTLDGGQLKNNDSSPVIPPTMGITLGPAGGIFCIGWNAAHTMTYQCPITGPGALTISYNNGRHILMNPANDWAGGTIVGARPDGWSTSTFAYLALGADGVLPYGAGKGGLLINGADRGLVDIAGSSNRVVSLTATATSFLTNSIPGQGALYADEVNFAGNLYPGARLVWCGPGPLALGIPEGAGRGEIALADDLTLDAPLSLGGATLVIDGQTIYASEAAVTANSGPLAIGPGGAALHSTGPSALVLRGGIIETADNTAPAPLTLNTSLIIDGPAAYPALLDADLALPQGATVTLRGSVVLNRLPPAGQWAADPGADIYLTAAIAGDLSPFEGCNLHIGSDNQAAFPSPLTISNNFHFTFDTFSLSGTAPFAAAHDIILDGGTLGFNGSDAITLSGAISGSGAIVKTGAGTATLSGANAFSGSVTVSNGLLAAATSAALGTAPVTLAGGRLGNAPGADVTLAQAVTVLSGGFTVSGGSLTLTGPLTLANGTLSKQGDGELILDGATFAAPEPLTLTGGAVIIDIPAGATNTIPALLGNADLIKRGAGALIVNPQAAYTGRIVMEDGILTQHAFPPPATGPALWLDASDAASITLDAASGVTLWRDTREASPAVTNHPYARLNPDVPNDNGPGFKTALPPTLMAAALAGRPAVDFGAYRSGQWLALEGVPVARTFFWVIGSQNGGGHLIGAPDRGLCRGETGGGIENAINANYPLWNGGTWNALEVRNSQNWINGSPVTGTSTGLSGGWDLVSTIASGPIPLSTLQKEGRVIPTGQGDGAGRSGGGRIAEFIVYDRALSIEERQATETYLRAKWFGGAASAWKAELAVTGDSELALPSAFNALRIDRLTGTATLAKTGPGAFTAENPDAFTGTLALAEGAFSADGPSAALTKHAAPTNPVPGAAFWVDASVEGSFGKDENNRMYWLDARWQEEGDWICATQRWAVAPSILSNAVGALPVIDMGPTNQMAGMHWTQPVYNITAAFFLFGSQNGGGILLGNILGEGTFNRGVDNAPPSIPMYHSGYAHANVRNGITRQDGIQVNGTVTGFSGGYQVIALRTAGNGDGVLADTFAHDREMGATDRRHGGQRLGEVIIYTNALTDAEFAAVEAYLMDKWQRPGTRGQPATLRALDIPGPAADPSPALAVDIRTLNVNTLSGDGTARKTGDATLAVGRYEPFSGELEISGGTATFAGKTAYRHIRLTISAIRGGGTTEDPVRTSLSELEIFKGGAKIPWPPGTLATGSDWLTQSPGYGPEHLIDGQLNANGRWITLGLPSWAQFDLLAPTEFDAYTLITGSEGNYHYRDPTAWTFEASHDGITWETLDAKAAQSYPSANNHVIGPIPVTGGGGGGETSAMTLTLRPGASAAFAHGAHTLNAIGGIGAISGGALTVSGLNLAPCGQPGDALALASPLTVTDGADWAIEAGPEGIAPLDSTEAITFEGGGTLTLTGAAHLPNGETPIARAAPLTGLPPAAWAILTDDPTRHFSLTTRDDTLFLRITPKGTLILVK